VATETSRSCHIIDFLTLHPDARRRVVQVLGEIEAST
jgi:hypothetical protein